VVNRLNDGDSNGAGELKNEAQRISALTKWLASKIVKTMVARLTIRQKNELRVCLLLRHDLHETMLLRIAKNKPNSTKF